jgi:hypothetical protein
MVVASPVHSAPETDSTERRLADPSGPQTAPVTSGLCLVTRTFHDGCPGRTAHQGRDLARGLSMREAEGLRRKKVVLETRTAGASVLGGLLVRGDSGSGMDRLTGSWEDQVVRVRPIRACLIGAVCGVRAHGKMPWSR